LFPFALTSHVQANKANAISRLGEETAACDKAIELFNANEMQQVLCDLRSAPFIRVKHSFSPAESRHSRAPN
jgi:hypothetical protein